MSLPTPIIETERLALTALMPADTDEIRAIMDDQLVSDNTLTLQYPYTRDHAIAFIERIRSGIESGTEVCFSIRLRDSKTLVGTIGQTLTTIHQRAELGYIVGKDFRGNGYATEACRGFLGYSFGVLGLHKVTAAWYTDNPASGRILEKLGFANEGIVREHFFRGGRWRDSVTMGLLRQDYEDQQQSAVG
jgi:RimJ/RimL family protein N-acetyltransferase